jgi:hypothetical protein
MYFTLVCKLNILSMLEFRFVWLSSRFMNVNENVNTISIWFVIAAWHLLERPRAACERGKYLFGLPKKFEVIKKYAVFYNRILWWIPIRNGKCFNVLLNFLLLCISHSCREYVQYQRLIETC